MDWRKGRIFCVMHAVARCAPKIAIIRLMRSEEHTSELQSLTNLVCRLLLEKKKLVYLLFLILSNSVLCASLLAPDVLLPFY